jgi:hypothetical protein
MIWALTLDILMDVASCRVNSICKVVCYSTSFCGLLVPSTLLIESFIHYILPWIRGFIVSYTFVIKGSAEQRFICKLRQLLGDAHVKGIVSLMKLCTV